MGEIGAYSLHLYCDHPDAGETVCQTRLGKKAWPGDFVAQNLTGARAHARFRGWMINPRGQTSDASLGGGRVLCPMHNIRSEP